MPDNQPKYFFNTFLFGGGVNITVLSGMKHTEYINGVVDMIISDYKHYERNFSIELRKTSYSRPNDTWTCEIWYADVEWDEWQIENVSFTTPTPLIEIRHLIHATLDSIVL